jgi:hypothetical protein
MPKFTCSLEFDVSANVTVEAATSSEAATRMDALADAIPWPIEVPVVVEGTSTIVTFYAGDLRMCEVDESSEGLIEPR